MGSTIFRHFAMDKNTKIAIVCSLASNCEKSSCRPARKDAVMPVWPKRLYKWGKWRKRRKQRCRCWCWWYLLASPKLWWTGRHNHHTNCSASTHWSFKFAWMVPMSPTTIFVDFGGWAMLEASRYFWILRCWLGKARQGLSKRQTDKAKRVFISLGMAFVLVSWQQRVCS